MVKKSDIGLWESNMAPGEIYKHIDAGKKSLTAELEIMGIEFPDLDEFSTSIKMYDDYLAGRKVTEEIFNTFIKENPGTEESLVFFNIASSIFKEQHTELEKSLDTEAKHADFIRLSVATICISVIAHEEKTNGEFYKQRVKKA